MYKSTAAPKTTTATKANYTQDLRAQNNECPIRRMCMKLTTQPQHIQEMENKSAIVLSHKMWSAENMNFYK